jgi:hypothetical protein
MNIWLGCVVHRIFGGQELQTPVGYSTGQHDVVYSCGRIDQVLRCDFLGDRRFRNIRELMDTGKTDIVVLPFNRSDREQLVNDVYSRGR